MGTNINLSGQNAKMQAALPHLQDLQTAMNQRLPIWEKIKKQKRQKWVQWNGDQVMKRMYQTWQFLNGFFEAM